MTKRSVTKEKAYILPSGRVITGTLVWYYHICEREVWLMGRNLTPDQEYPSLDIGRVVHETFYARSKKELSFEGMKIDMLRSGSNIICEVKTSSRYQEASRMQLLYYLYRLKQMGVDAEGELLIPKERKKIEVKLTPELESKVVKTLKEIKAILEKDKPPPPIKKHFCKRCAYKELCWA